MFELLLTSLHRIHIQAAPLLASTGFSVIP
jgi:hypothetical protein